jgi:multidrug resistance protein, MATE family
MSTADVHSATKLPGETRHPLWEMIRLAIPSVATMTSFTVMQFIDALMVARITTNDAERAMNIAAQGNGGVMSFVPLSIIMGIASMINTFVSQNLGAGQERKAAAYAWTGLWLALFGALAVVPYGLAMPFIFNLQHGGDPNISPRQIELQTQYAQVLVFGAFFLLAARAISHFFYGLHRPTIVLIAAVAGNLTNIFGNWLLIYGNWGFPQLGVMGAAIATVIGTMVELAIPLVVFLSSSMHARYATRTPWRFSWPHLKDLFKTGWAPALMFGNEMICWAIFMSALVGRFGPDQNAASWIALRYMHMSFMPAVGMSIAIAAMVGKCMGAKRPDLAAKRAWLGIYVAMAYMTLCAIAMIVFREPLVGYFLQDAIKSVTDLSAIDATQATQAAELAAQQAASRDVVMTVGMQLMILAALFQTFDGLGIAVLGALRGAGDTLVPGIVTMILTWTCIIGVGYSIMHFAPQLGALGPWLGAAVYIIALGIFLLTRFLSGKWKSIDLLKQSATTAAH